VGLVALIAWGLVTRRVPLTAVVCGVVAVASVAAFAFAVWAPEIHDKLQSKEQIAASNVASRRALWSGAVSMWGDRPITGVGPGRFGDEATTYVRNEPLAIRDPVVHNSYLQALAETGALGLGAFLAFLATTWHLLTRARARALAEGDVEGGRLVTAMHGAMVIAVVSACFLSVELTTPFWLIGALAVVVARAKAPPETAHWPAAAST
jgi:O-antigen ligase